MRVLVTGGSGYLGVAVAEELIRRDCVPVIFSRDPGRQIERCSQLGVCVAGDIQDPWRMNQVCKEHQIEAIVHCAAYKYQDRCEQEPIRAVAINLIGTQNVLDVATANGIHRAVFVSSDKATDSSVYGCTKFLGERIVTERARALGAYFNCVRPGNLLGSTGSVWPIWQKQIAAGGPLILNLCNQYAPRRFVMTAKEAATLIVDTLLGTRMGQVVCQEMPVMDLCILSHTIVPNGFRFSLRPIPASLLHQVLITADESRHVEKVGRTFFLSPGTEFGTHTWEYSTRAIEPMTEEQTRTWLEKAGLLTT